MNLLQIRIGDIVVILPQGENSALVVAAFAGATVFETDWNGQRKPKAATPEFSFIDPSRTDANPHVAAANCERDQYQKWFSQGEEKLREANKRIAELERAVATAAAADI